MSSSTLTDAVEAFLAASVNGRLGVAGRLLHEHPAIAGFDVRTAIALGDAERVEAELARDPSLVTRRDPASGWTALHLAVASRWHADPARAAGLAAIAARLLDAGADLHHAPTADSQWTPLRCAVASAASGPGNEPIIALLLDRGARVADHDLYLAGFARGEENWCVRLLIRHTPDLPAIAEQAMAAPISRDDAGGVGALLEAGADLRRYRDDDGRPAGAVSAAIDAGAGVALIELLLAHGADPNQAGADGRSVFAHATADGRADLTHLLTRHGARDDATALDRLQYACLQGDAATVQAALADQPELRDAAATAAADALTRAAELGNTQGLALLLQAGFSAAATAGPQRATALHTAAHAGSAEAVSRLLAAGAPIDALDGEWQSTALIWALVGSGERPALNPAADWRETVAILLDGGAATDRVALDPDDANPPDADVVALLRERGVLAP